MGQVRIDFEWHGKAQTCSSACVQPMGDDLQLTLGVAREVGALGQVLSQQAIGILVGPALQRAVRISKEHLDRESVRQPRIFQRLFPRSWVTVVRSGACTDWSFFIKSQYALAASVPSMRASRTRRVELSCRPNGSPSPPYAKPVVTSRL